MRAPAIAYGHCVENMRYEGLTDLMLRGRDYT